MIDSRDNDAGYILVAVLSVMLLLTGFVAAGSVLMRSALHGAVVGDSALAMQGLAQGGLELTAYQLLVRKVPAPQVDGHRIRFAGGTIQPRIVDEAGKIDLNGADPRLLTSTFASIGIDGDRAAALVTRIIEIRGANRASTISSVGLPARDIFNGNSPIASGLVDSSLGASGGTTGKRIRGWQSVEQSREALGLSRTEYRALLPLLTVYNPDGRVDILTASRAILTAIPGLTGPKIDLIIIRRIGATNEADAALKQLLVDASLFVKITPGPAYTVHVDAVSGSGQRKTLEAVIAASKSPNDPYLILEWRDGDS